jgi:hypothetical protein
MLHVTSSSDAREFGESEACYEARNKTPADEKQIFPSDAINWVFKMLKLLLLLLLRA